MTVPHTNATQRAWVVFTNETELPWLRLFRRGFRHCFVLIHDGACWISVDPMAHHMAVTVHHEIVPGFDLSRWLMRRGHHVCAAQINHDIGRPAPVMMLTCVEACKRILGIRRRFILTPWQLYRYLKQTQRQTEGENQWEV